MFYPPLTVVAVLSLLMCHFICFDFFLQTELFQLVTDQGLLHEPRVVWETLSNIEGDGLFVDSCFVTVPPKAAGSYHAVSLDVSKDEQISHE